MSRRLPYIDLPATHSFIERGSGAKVVGTCSKGEFLKCTEDDRAGRTRMAAGRTSLGHLSSGRTKKGDKYILRLFYVFWFVRLVSAAC